MSLLSLLLNTPSASDRFQQIAPLVGGSVGLSSGPVGSSGGAPAPTAGGSNWERVARDFFERRGYTPGQINAVDAIVTPESGWNPNAVNPSSGAAGIAQNISGYGQGYEQDDPMSQIRWLYRYLENRYGGPEEALAFRQDKGWY